MANEHRLMCLVDQVNALKFELTKITEAIEDCNAEIKKICQHPFMNDKETYVPGGYGHRAEIKRWKECSICGHTTDVVIKYGSHG